MDKANWSPEEAVQLAKKLNNYGTHYRNAVACLYNTFTFEISKYWRGYNYNKVAEFVNAHYKDFDTIAANICIAIPSNLQQIAIIQAEDGLGSVTKFNYELDIEGDGTIPFNLIPMTEKPADGSIQLTEELTTKLFYGNSEPSIMFYKDRMLEYMNSYISTLEQFRGIEEYNIALQHSFNLIETFKKYSEYTLNSIFEELTTRTQIELGKISDTNTSATNLAVRSLQDFIDNRTSTSTSGNNYSTNKGPSTSATNSSGTTSSSTSGTNYTVSKGSSTSATNSSGTTSSSTSGTNYTVSKGSSTSGTNPSK